MKNYDYWKNFTSSGRIDDYLHYIACTRESMDEIGPAADVTRNLEKDKEGGFGAGINYSDGDGSIGHASW